MRSFGTHRGNSALRVSVEQASRRRLGATLVPHDGAEPTGFDPALKVRFTRRFFDRILERVLPRMAPALTVDDAEVSYFGTDELCLWAMRSAGGVVLAYECEDTPAILRDRARRWLACLRTRTAPGMLTRTWGHPVYGARLDSTSGDLDIVWATPGSWCGFVLADEPGPRMWNLPPAWPTVELAGA